jgi:hypothetical protein
MGRRRKWRQNFKVAIGAPETRGCQIFLGASFPNWEKCTKLPQNILNGSKIYEMVIKRPKLPQNILNCNTLYQMVV